jgi:hypothetical protein
MTKVSASLLLLCVSFAVGQQPNSTVASMIIDGAVGPPYPIQGANNAGVPVRTNVVSVVDVSGGGNAPFLIAQSATGNVQANAAFVLGGKLDLPFSPPVKIWIDGFGPSGVGIYKTAASGSFALNVLVPSNLVINSTQAFQAAVFNPFQPPPFQAALTAATKVLITQGPIITTHSLGNGGQITQTLTGWTFPFYGTAYSTLYTKADGYMNMGAVANDFSSSPSQMTSGPPRITPFWTDLDQGAIGSTKTTLDNTPPAGTLPYYKVEFINVIDWNNANGFLHTFGWQVDSSGFVTMSIGPTNQQSVFETMACVVPGNNAGVGAMLDLSAVQDTGGLVGGLNEQFHEWFGLTTMPTYSLNQNRPYDLTGRTLTFVPIYVQPTGPTSLVQSTKAYLMF